MTPIGWFGKTVAGAGLALVLGLSGCTSVSPKHGPETVSRSSPTAASSATATSHGTKIDVTWAHLYRSDFGAAAEYVCSAGQQCRWRLETTRDQGRHWRDITPAGAERGPNGFAPFFLNPSRIWVATVDCAGGKGRVYRSVDAGRTWQGTAGPGVSCAQGSVTPEFLDATDGYLVALQPTAPDAYLMRTSDGGMTWKPVRTHSVMGGVPVVAPVSFTSVKDGWAGGGWFAWGNLYVTKDGGVHWRRAFGGQAQPTFLPDVPTPVGDELVLPITLQEQGHLGVRFDRSIDGGSTWTPASVADLRLPRALVHEAFASLARPFPTAVVGPSVWWVAAGSSVYRTNDAGANWQRIRLKASRPLSISAVDGMTAWIVTDGVLLVTTNGGRTWRMASL